MWCAADPYSPTPWDAICARGDLDPEEPVASGCYDAKVRRCPWIQGSQHARTMTAPISSCRSPRLMAVEALKTR